MYAGSLHGFFMAAAFAADDDPVAGGADCVGANSADGTSVPIPAHQAGDLILIWAWNNAGTQPAAPDGTWTTHAGASRSGAASKNHRLAYKVAASASETSGTWTSADSVHVHVYRGASGLGAGDRMQDGSSDPDIPSLSLNVTDGSSVVAAFAMALSTTNMTIADMAARTANNVAGTGYAESWDTNEGVASFSGRTNLASSGGLDWASCAVEILAA